VLAPAQAPAHIRTMATFVTILLVLALAGVLIVLASGVVQMFRGGNPRRSNKLMQMRVIMQGLALLLLAILMLLGRR
jgi:NADH:ubiquinone oxidoreductase subunit 6 (subunit J)